MVIVFVVLAMGLGLIVMGAISSESVVTMRMPKNHSRGGKFKLSADLFNKIFPFSRGFLEKTGLYGKIKLQLDGAHSRMTPIEFFNIKLFLMLALSVGSVIALGKADPMIILVALGLGYYVPQIYLKKKLSKRKDAIVRVLPETIDLLGLCIEAGLDFGSAVRWVIEKTTMNPATEELAVVLEEIKWGKPRIQALKDMSRRLDIPEISSFVQTIIQAERMGTPVAEAFTILSEDTRAQRFHRGERIALQAPIKILVPLIFCIMPVIGIVIGGPILLQFMQGGLGAGIK
jgi:tight adherence protein C